MTTQEIREQIIKALDELPLESLAGVLDYVQFISEPEAVTPMADELRVIRRGEDEYSRGECVRWRDMKRHDVRCNPHQISRNGVYFANRTWRTNSTENRNEQRGSPMTAGRGRRAERGRATLCI